MKLSLFCLAVILQFVVSQVTAFSFAHFYTNRVKGLQLKNAAIATLSQRNVAAQMSRLQTRINLPSLNLKKEPSPKIADLAMSNWKKSATKPISLKGNFPKSFPKN
jgi:hypothetical protein